MTRRPIVEACPRCHPVSETEGLVEVRPCERHRALWAAEAERILLEHRESEQEEEKAWSG